MNNDMVAAEVQSNDMLRIANNLDFEAIDRNGQDVPTRKTNVAIRVVTKGMEITGGKGFYRGFAWSGCAATCKPRAIIRCRKASRRSFPVNICCATEAYYAAAGF